MRSELAAFLRDRRARVRPSDVGLPAGPRRRTPGLRREEVAQLAAVGASWYTWLEQGRDIAVSEAFLERLASALRLSASERAYLFQLAQGRAPRAASDGESEVSPALERALEGYAYPALAMTRRWDIVACNRACTLLFGDLVGLNGLSTMFTGTGLNVTFLDRATYCRKSVARFRMEAGRAPDRAPFDELAAELSLASPEFRELWRGQDVQEAGEITKAIVHPEIGTITFDCLTLHHIDGGGQPLRIALDIPQPGESTERAARLFKP